MDSLSVLGRWAALRRREESASRRYTLLDTGFPDRSRAGLNDVPGELGDSNSSAVLILSGVAVPWVDWADVLSLLSSRERVVLVERDGMEGPLPQPLPPSPAGAASSPSLVDEAHAVAALLDTLKIARVRILAHSMGAFIGEAFARLYPERCEHLVFVDGSCTNPPTYASGTAESVPELRRAGLTERLLLRAARCAWVRALYARVLWWPRRRGLRTIAREEERVYAQSFFADERFIHTMWQEMRVYDLWAQELNALTRRLPLRCELRVAVATRHRVLQDPWVVRQRARFEALDAEIEGVGMSGAAGRSGAGVQNSYEVVSASHLLMRDNPELVASLTARRHESP